jgi:hypothetical protein
MGLAYRPTRNYLDLDDFEVKPGDAASAER